MVLGTLGARQILREILQGWQTCPFQESLLLVSPLWIIWDSASRSCLWFLAAPTLPPHSRSPLGRGFREVPEW